MYSALKTGNISAFEINQIVGKRWGRYVFNWGGGKGGA